MLQQDDVQGALEGTASPLNPNMHSRVDAGTFLNEKLYKVHIHIYIYNLIRIIYTYFAANFCTERLIPPAG